MQTVSRSKQQRRQQTPYVNKRKVSFNMEANKTYITDEDSSGSDSDNDGAPAAPNPRRLSQPKPLAFPSPTPYPSHRPRLPLRTQSARLRSGGSPCTAPHPSRAATINNQVLRQLQELRVKMHTSIVFRPAVPLVRLVQEHLAIENVAENEVMKQLQLDLHRLTLENTKLKQDISLH
jgi:hypothetical protein